MDEQYESEYYRGFEIKIYQDSDTINPMEDWDGWANFRCFHRDYSLSNTEEFEYPEDLVEYLKKGEAIHLPLFLYDHSGISISANGDIYPFNDRWDAGQVGFVYEKISDLKKEFGWKIITKKRRQKIIDRMLSEVSIFDDYLRGNVYGFDVEDVGSCWGFYGYEHEKSGLLEAAQNDIDYYISEERKKHAKYLKEMIKNKVSFGFRKPAIV